MTWVLGIFCWLMIASAASAATWATEWTQLLNYLELARQSKNEIDMLYNDAMMIRNQVEQLKSIASYKGNWEDINRIIREIEYIKQRNDVIWNNAQGEYTRIKKAFPQLIKEGNPANTINELNVRKRPINPSSTMVNLPLQ